MEPRPLLERQRPAQGAGIERLDPTEGQADHPLAWPFLEGDGELQILALLVHPGRPGGRLGEAVEGIVALEAVQVVFEHGADEPAAAGAQEAALGGLEDLAQLVVRDLLVPFEADLAQGVLGAGLDAEGEDELAFGPLLFGLDGDAVMPFLLEVALEAAHGLEDQGLVVPGLAEERQEVPAAEGLLVRPEDDEGDAGADLDGIGELDGAAFLVDLLARRLDPGGTVALAHEPVLEALGVLAGQPAAEGRAGLLPELLDESGRREGSHGVVEGDGAHGGPGAALDVVGDHGPPQDRIGVDRDAGPAAEVAVLLVQILDGVDAAQDPLLGEGLGLLLGNGPAQGVAVEAQVAGDADLLDLHDGAEDDEDGHRGGCFPGIAIGIGIGPRVDLDLGGRAGRLEVPQGVADVLVVERPAGLGLDQALQVERLVEGGVAADLDGRDDRGRWIRSWGNLVLGARQLLGGHQPRPRQGEGDPERRDPQSLQEVPQKRRWNWASTA